MKYASAYGIALVIFLVLDGLWLGVVAKGSMRRGWGTFWLTIRAGVSPRRVLCDLCDRAGLFRDFGGHGSGKLESCPLNGALFGFFCYLTYDATNLAVLKGYDPLIAVSTRYGVRF